MRRVPSCLLFAFALSFCLANADGALGGPGFRHGPASHHRAWGGHTGFNRGHWTKPRHGFAAPWRFPRHSRHFFARCGHPHHGYRHRGYRHHAYPAYFYGHPGYGDHGYGSLFYGHRGYGGHVYGYRGYGSHPYSYGRHGYRHPFYGVHGYGYHGYRHFPHWTGSYLDTSGEVTVPIIVHADVAPPPSPPAIPSVADLRVAMGIRSAPAASPAIYVLNSDGRSLRGRGAKIVDTAEAEDLAVGPRIIRLDVPRGR
jgi:hypothetical protein